MIAEPDVIRIKQVQIIWMLTSWLVSTPNRQSGQATSQEMAVITSNVNLIDPKMGHSLLLYTPFALAHLYLSRTYCRAYYTIFSVIIGMETKKPN